MRIAICDNDVLDRSVILSLIAEYKGTKDTVDGDGVFQSGAELLDAMERGERYDVMLLDILMPGVDGMQTAKEIRDFDSETKIIFLTSSVEFALQGYSVQAYHYLIKPATAQTLFPILDRAFSAMQKPEECLTVRIKSGILRIPFRRIEYVEVVERTVYFHLNDGNVREVCASFVSFETQLLERFGFVKTHRSYIVNMRWIREIEAKNILMASGQRIPIARKSFTLVRDAYMEYLFAEDKME